MHSIECPASSFIRHTVRGADWQAYLSGRAERMSKVNANNSSSLQVNHEVWEMTISNTKYVMTDAQLGVRDCKLTTQAVERLGAGT